MKERLAAVVVALAVVEGVVVVVVVVKMDPILLPSPSKQSSYCFPFRRLPRRSFHC